MTNYIVIETVSGFNHVDINYEVRDSEAVIDEIEDMEVDWERLCELPGGPTAENLCDHLWQSGHGFTITAKIPEWTGDYVICRDTDGCPFGVGETFIEALCTPADWHGEDQSHPSAREVLRLLENREFFLLIGGEAVDDLPALDEFALKDLG